jgi:hypothetical protein
VVEDLLVDTPEHHCVPTEKEVREKPSRNQRTFEAAEGNGGSAAPGERRDGQSSEHCPFSPCCHDWQHHAAFRKKSGGKAKEFG